MRRHPCRAPARLLVCALDNNDNSGGGPGCSTSYVGLVASSSGLTGPLSITFASAVVNATGTVSLGPGAPVAISGALDGGSLNMTGGGWTTTGTPQNGELGGTFTAPGPADGIVIAGTSVVGSGGSGIIFSGTATASTIMVNETAPEGSLTATGEYDEFGIGGSYAVKVGAVTISAGGLSGGTCEQPT